MAWLIFTLIAMTSVGFLGVFTHAGQRGMEDPDNGRYKVLLFAGIGYSLVAIVGSGSMLEANGAEWNFPTKGLSLAALVGVAIVVVILSNLLAFQAEGTPAVVMTILFTGASLINAVVALTIDTPQAGGLRWQFIVGIQLAILGICMVTIYRPGM